LRSGKAGESVMDNREGENFRAGIELYSRLGEFLF